ncbi:MAG: tRNA guanosine(34) transglycosylase Tgt [Caldilineaceae bacterium]|nr:tRNA guanosine(34) transglycosylase Tgt [Caldilineaceae bacterium]
MTDQTATPNPPPFTYTLEAQDGRARAGTFSTPHGPIHMPAFAPVGTLANVKTLEPRDLVEVGAELILANTYHLYLRPGHELIERFGGLHTFMRWDGPILTDSGGFQVFSLADQRKLDDDGVTFRSHIDGSTHRFTPERVMEIEQALGPDIAMVLDECPDPLEREYNVAALARTHRWAARCKAAHTRPDQALFGIVQGGVFPDLRLESAAFLSALDFPGYAVGGLAVGETKEQMYAILDETCPALPAHKPRYLMGVGTPEDVIEAVYRGIDMFDCVLPTRIARNGAVFTPAGRVNLRNARFAEDHAPIQEDCMCYTCRTFSRAYLRHLYKAGEVTALRLGTIHNVHFMLDLMRRIRAAIMAGTYDTFRDAFWDRYQISDQKVRHEQRAKRQAAMRDS